ncbi:MAG: PilZ domain-containing protein [Desulfobacterales bacterium]|nr:MAG: PilZ domain-containing protein [Desulfobacterales bacterium]
MVTSSEKLFVNKRKEPRQSYSGEIFFAYKKHLYKGKLKNLSPSGLFIQADSIFIKGEMITVSLPVSKYKNNKQRGRIVWNNTKGCGVQLCE